MKTYSNKSQNFFVFAFLALLSLVGCLTESSTSDTYEVNYTVRLTQLADTIPVDSIVVNYSVDKVIADPLVFAKAEIRTDINGRFVTFLVAATEGAVIEVNYTIYADGQILAAGSDSFDTEEDPEDQPTEPIRLDTSVIAEIIRERFSSSSVEIPSSSSVFVPSSSSANVSSSSSAEASSSSAVEGTSSSSVPVSSSSSVLVSSSSSVLVSSSSSVLVSSSSSVPISSSSSLLVSSSSIAVSSSSSSVQIVTIQFLAVSEPTSSVLEAASTYQALFTVNTNDGLPLSKPIELKYTTAGSVTPNLDFRLLPASPFTIPVGKQMPYTDSLAIQILSDTETESTELLEINLEAGLNYQLGTTRQWKLTIVDPVPTTYKVYFHTADVTETEGQTGVVITSMKISGSNSNLPLASPIVVPLVINGTLSDEDVEQASITFPAGYLSGDPISRSINVIADSWVEGPETATITPASPYLATGDSESGFTLTALDANSATVIFRKSDPFYPTGTMSIVEQPYGFTIMDSLVLSPTNSRLAKPLQFSLQSTCTGAKLYTYGFLDGTVNGATEYHSWEFSDNLDYLPGTVYGPTHSYTCSTWFDQSLPNSIPFTIDTASTVMRLDVTDNEFPLGYLQTGRTISGTAYTDTFFTISKSTEHPMQISLLIDSRITETDPALFAQVNFYNGHVNPQGSVETKALENKDSLVINLQGNTNTSEIQIDLYMSSDLGTHKYWRTKLEFCAANSPCRIAISLQNGWSALSSLPASVPKVPGGNGLSFSSLQIGPTLGSAAGKGQLTIQSISYK